MSTIKSALAAALAVATVTTLGCAGRHDSLDNATVSGGTEAMSSESDVEAMSSSFVGGGGSGTAALSLAGHGELTGGGDVHAQTLGDTAKALYQPAGCLVVTNDVVKQVATYAFSDCTGPYRMVHLTGTVTVDYSASTASALVLKFAATGLQINHATVTWSASASITGQGSARDMVWDGQFSGTTGGGRAFQRTNHKEYKWTVGAACLAVSGSSDGTVTGKEIKVDVINFSRCLGACPEAGSEVKVTDVAANLAYDVKYNASDATYTAPGGQQFEFRPFCAE